jgi:hypothetical protein
MTLDAKKAARKFMKFARFNANFWDPNPYMKGVTETYWSAARVLLLDAGADWKTVDKICGKTAPRPKKSKEGK